MSGNKKLKELLTNRPIDFRKIEQYGRSKNVDVQELIELTSTYAYLVQDKEYGHLLTPLHVACSRSKPDIVALLLNEGYSIDHSMGSIESPLCVALEHGNIPVAHLLVKMGANTTSMGRNGYTPIVPAMTPVNPEKCCVTGVKLLLECGVPVNDVVVAAKQQRAIHVAVSHNLPPVVSFLLQMDADPNVGDINGHTPLHLAIGCNFDNIVNLLVLHKVDLYKENIRGESPLILAIKRQNLKNIETLIKNGYDPNKINSVESFLPLHAAALFCKLDIIKLLVNLGANVNLTSKLWGTPLHALASKLPELSHVINQVQEQKDIAEFLVKKGAELNVADDSMNTPLHIAVKSGYLGLAKHFVTMGAHVDSRLIAGETLFHKVVLLNHDIIEKLLEYGGNFNVCNKQGFTPYHLAIMNKVDVRFIKSFVKHGCPYNQKVSIWNNVVKKCNRETQLFFNAEKRFFKGIKENNLELVKSAVTDGAVLTGRSEGMMYPLHYVAKNGYKELLVYFLQQKFPPNVLNRQDETPLYLAAKQGYYEICCILLRYGACYNFCSNKCPKTPLKVAHEFNQKKIMFLLRRVNKMFALSRSNESLIVSKLESMQKIDILEYLVFANAINVRGHSLMETAFFFKNTTIAQAMLKLRLNCEL
ncbi:ankyrin-1-like [Homalodisca vitripennis]|uniref:ankyrin-1-like n=1 Tax=Homalodisca vitripennis TaxID=197043 RepID=UPI001EEC695D|nr:ankyrin-1-like [Homalodisca vitripennis]